MLERKGFVVDELTILPYIKKDQRHNSKPDTGALFKKSNIMGSITNTFSVFCMVLGRSGVLVVLTILVILIAYLML